MTAEKKERSPGRQRFRNVNWSRDNPRDSSRVLQDRNRWMSRRSNGYRNKSINIQVIDQMI